jgi:hypothetical protein
MPVTPKHAPDTDELVRALFRAKAAKEAATTAIGELTATLAEVCLEQGEQTLQTTDEDTGDTIVATLVESTSVVVDPKLLKRVNAEQRKLLTKTVVTVDAKVLDSLVRTEQVDAALVKRYTTIKPKDPHFRTTRKAEGE